MKTTLFSKAALFFALASVSMFSCKKDEDEPAPVGNARYQIVHVAADGPQFDIYQGTGRILTNFAYGTKSDYRTIKAQGTNIDFTEAGQSPKLAATTISPVEGADYTVFLIRRDVAGTAYDALTLRDTVSGGTTGQAYVRFVHTLVNGGNVTFAQDSLRLIPNAQSTLPYKGYTRFLPFNAGSKRFDLLNAGNSAIILSRTVTLDANTYYTIAATGNNVAGTAPVELKQFTHSRP